jgi:hypothetical protein
MKASLKLYRMVLKHLTEQHNNLGMCNYLLSCCCHAFLHHAVSNEKWIHYYEPRVNTKVWNGSTWCPVRKVFRSEPAAGEVVLALLGLSRTNLGALSEMGCDNK